MRFEKKTVIAPLSDQQLRQSIYVAALLALLLPPFIGGTLMGIVGFYPLPEFYFIFFSYSGLYVLTVVIVVIVLLPRVYRHIVELVHKDSEQAGVQAKITFARLPWYLFAFVTVYSMFGAFSADLSLESLGYQHYALQDHLYNQFGIIPVVLITTFPIFFYFVDHLGLYLGPRGVSVIAVPLWLKLLMLGIVTPLLIDSLLISYFYNRTDYFQLETLVLWFSLLGLAIGGTWFAWRSFQQGITPLEQFLSSHYDSSGIVSNCPTPLSLDELGVLTSRFAGILTNQNKLTENLKRAESLANAVIDNAGALVVVLNHEGRIVRFNHACEQISGYFFEDVEGKYPWDTVLPAEEADTIRQQAFEAMANDPTVMGGHYINDWVSRNGERHLIEWSNTLILENGKMEYMVSVGIDITERKQAEQHLLKSTELLNEAQRIAKVGSWTLDLKTNQLVWSDEIFRLFELDKEKFQPSYEAFLDAIHPEDRERVRQAYAESLENRKPYKLIHRLLFGDGRIKCVEEACETLYDEDGQPVLSRGTVQDVTEQKQAEETVRLYASVFRHSAEAILITDHENRIVAINPALTHLTGYTLDELIGENPRILASGRTSQEIYDEMWRSLEKIGHWHGELNDKRKNGEVYPKWATISVIRNDEGKVINYIASFSDISERKAAEERIHHLAHHDALTGVYNRFSLKERMGQAVAQAQRENNQLAVLFIDLDRFKVVNDRLGHHVGDALLVEVAKRLKESVRASDIVARLGGDEFVIVLTGVESSEVVASVAETIVEQVGEIYKISGHELHSSPSVGISLFPKDGQDVDGLMKNADMAMYHVKEQGRNNYQFFSEEFNKVAHERVMLEHDLRAALEKGQFELYYQPKVKADNGWVNGVEALVRWNHPQHGLIMPDKFIAIAEETGLIHSLGEWVINEACRQHEVWRRQDGVSLKISVNLSAKELRDSNMVKRLQQTMEKYNVVEGDLELEITETAVMLDAEYGIEQLEAIRAAGVCLSIDDFGTGCSSLAHLKSFPIQTLKLDRTFVRDIDNDENDAAICLAAISLSQDLGLKVVAEGVETEKQKEFLTSHKCDSLQGYLFSQPLPADEVMAFINLKA